MTILNRKTTKNKGYINMRYFLLWLVLVIFMGILFSYRSSYPRSLEIIRENENLIEKIGSINKNINNLNQQINTLKLRDEGTYRVVLGLDSPTVLPENFLLPTPIDTVRYNDRYLGYINYIWNNLNKTKINTINVSVAFDTVSYLASRQIDIARSIPAIWPIDVKDFSGSIGHYGWRKHPILNRRIKHDGLDLGCNVGCPIYATADGVVKYVRTGWNGGYGTEVVIDHGVGGYKTKYTHLKKALLKRGTQVKRGDKIALSGSTGRSTGPHLHYEIIYKGQTVNPLNYFRRDFSKDDFTRMLRDAKKETFEIVDDEDDELPSKN